MEQIFERPPLTEGGLLRLWSEDLYKLMELPLLSTTSFLWSLNLLFGTRLWPSLHSLGIYLSRKQRKTTTNYTIELVNKGFD